MSIRALLISALLLTPSFLVHAETVSLAVGETTVLFPAPAGYVAIGDDQPKLFEYSAAALPPSNRLVESFYTPADLHRLFEGEVVGDLYYQVQTLRSLESRNLSVDDWSRLKSELTAAMPKLDMKKIAAGDTKRNERMSEAAGQSVELKFDNLESPKIFRETPTSVTYGMVVPIKVSADNDAIQATLAIAGATLLARNKLLYVFAYTSDVSPAGIDRLHRSFDATIDEMVRLNASDPEARSTGSIDWDSVAKKALIGGLIGAVVGLIGWLIRKRGKAS